MQTEYKISWNGAPAYHSGRLCVKFKQTTLLDTAVQNLLHLHPSLELIRIKHTFRTVLFQLHNPDTILEIIRVLSTQEVIEWVEPDFIFSHQGDSK